MKTIKYIFNRQTKGLNKLHKSIILLIVTLITFCAFRLLIGLVISSNVPNIGLL